MGVLNPLGLFRFWILRFLVGRGLLLRYVAVENGGDNAKVGEHPAVVIFELEAYPEPKILSSKELQELLKTHSYRDLAKSLGCSIGFICERLGKSKSD